ncbi:hypothetical protein A1D22_05875 [Pasteurellaceae bacterium LFhippo2]|nr:hypothetical protein [Pasteurellaceae bacterium LFhippo2]
MTNQISTQLSTFTFENHSIRTIAINNEPWFIAKDICSSLNISNVTDALIKLDDDEKTILDNTLGLTESIGKQVQEVNLVSESGMYTLILRCRDAVKKGSTPHRFRKWVTAEVLPQIRKTGQYSVEQPNKVDPLRQMITKEMPVENWLRMVSVWYALYNCVDLLGKLERPLDLLGSSYSGQVCGHASEYKTTLGITKRILAPLLEDIEVPTEERHYYRALQEMRSYIPKGLGAVAII